MSTGDRQRTVVDFKKSQDLDAALFFCPFRKILSKTRAIFTSIISAQPQQHLRLKSARNHPFNAMKYLLILLVSATACSNLRIAGKHAGTPLEKALAAHHTDFDSILLHPEIYEVQIIYTRINRDAGGQPHFSSYYWNVDSTRYFYPASTVKLPLALLALEKLNRLGRQYSRLNKDTPYLLDSLRAFQENCRADPTAPDGKPSIAQDIRKVLVTSDNLAYNHLFEFLGMDDINQTLREKGYRHTGIVHRFNYPGRDNRFTSAVTFYDASSGIYQQGEIKSEKNWKNPQRETLKGLGYYNERDSLIREPFDFSRKNWLALTDLDRMIRAVIFPESLPEKERFDLTEEDYRFLRHYMSIFPRECDYPKYDTTAFYDTYVKFFLDTTKKEPMNGTLREFNKAGEAYGVLTDAAYIQDAENKTEFLLAATILCNRDGIFNDDRYDYDRTGFPFLANLGAAILEFERKNRSK